MSRALWVFSLAVNGWFAFFPSFPMGSGWNYLTVFSFIGTIAFTPLVWQAKKK